MKFNYFMPTRVIFGVNSLRKIVRFAQNAFDTMGGLFQVTPVKMGMEDVEVIYEAAFG